MNTNILDTFASLARAAYATDDIQIDDEPTVAIVQDNGEIEGAWVNAWVWVAAPDTEYGELT